MIFLFITYPYSSDFAFYDVNMITHFVRLSSYDFFTFTISFLFDFLGFFSNSFANYRCCHPCLINLPLVKYCKVTIQIKQNWNLEYTKLNILKCMLYIWIIFSFFHIHNLGVRFSFFLTMFIRELFPPVIGSNATSVNHPSPFLHENFS